MAKTHSKKVAPKASLRAKTVSSKSNKSAKVNKIVKTDKSAKSNKATKKRKFKFKLPKISFKRKDRQVKLHKSFRRSYREDYRRELEIPGIFTHAAETFKIIFKNWRLFIPFLILIVATNAVIVGIMSESTYHDFQDALDTTSKSIAGGEVGNVGKAVLLLISTITTGGLKINMSETETVFVVIIFLVVWLVTIYLLRHILAGNKVKLRDGIYNACSPFTSTLLIALLVFFECFPIFIFVVVQSAAIQTGFLDTPFYALVFFIFAALMFAISGYLLSSSLIALVAVSAPGLYPMKALDAASDLMASRRIKFILRIVSLIIIIAIMWGTIMVPIIVFDLWLKTFEWAQAIPIVPVALITMTVFSEIYLTAYLYLYYRWMLDYEEE